MASATSKPPSKPVQALKKCLMAAAGTQTDFALLLFRSTASIYFLFRFVKGHLRNSLPALPAAFPHSPCYPLLPARSRFAKDKTAVLHTEYGKKQSVIV